MPVRLPTRPRARNWAWRSTALGWASASSRPLRLVWARYRRLPKPNQYVLGVDSDQEAIFAESDPALASRVVSSVLKNVDVSLVRAYELYREGNLPFGSAETVGLAEGAVGIVETGNFESLASPETIAAIEDAKAAIAAGDVVVPTAFGMDSAAISALRDSVRP
jgi:basic membrane protein A